MTEKTSRLLGVLETLVTKIPVFEPAPTTAEFAVQRLVGPSMRELADIVTLVAFFEARNFPDTKEGNAAQALVPYIIRASRPNDGLEPSGVKPQQTTD